MLDEGSWLWNEHEALLHAEKKTFVRFDGAFDARLLVVTVILVSKFVDERRPTMVDQGANFIPAEVFCRRAYLLS